MRRRPLVAALFRACICQQTLFITRARLAFAAARRLSRLSLRACRLPGDTRAGAALASLLTEGHPFELDVSGCELDDASLLLLREAAAAAPRATLRCGD